MDRNVMLERLEWLALAGPHSAAPDWLAPNAWGEAIAAVAAAALDTIKEKRRAAYPADPENRSLLEVHYRDALERLGNMVWRPIAEAPIPGPDDGQPEYWMWSCLLQDDRGVVGEGFARYVHMRYRGRKPGPSVLRWYRAGNGGVWPNVKYFMPLPAKRED